MMRTMLRLWILLGGIGLSACSNIPNAGSLYFNLDIGTTTLDKSSQLMTSFVNLTAEQQRSAQGEMIRCQMYRNQLLVAERYRYQGQDAGEVMLKKMLMTYEESDQAFQSTCHDFSSTPLGTEFRSAQDKAIAQYIEKHPDVVQEQTHTDEETEAAQQKESVKSTAQSDTADTANTSKRPAEKSTLADR